MSPTPHCPQGHPMAVRSRFKFDHEPTDTDRDKESLRMFKAMGVELGPDVTLWYCATCDFAQADFAYPDREGTE